MADERPPWTAEFVLATPAVPRERHGRSDLFDPEAGEPRPLVVFVHGGPIPEDLPASPRDWPVYRGYGALAAANGVVGLTVDHRLHDVDTWGVAYSDVLDAAETARTDDRVDADRVAVWAFSGGGPLLAPLLAGPPPWLRVLAATYPILDSRPGRDLPEGFRPVQAVSSVVEPLPFVLTRVGLEAEDAAAAVERFVAAARDTALDLEIIDQPRGQHGFDAMDYGPESQACVMAAMESVVGRLSA
ncbi:MAG: hypothetical protein WKF54_01510 [Nocardioidaceae bacterium]